MTSACSRIARMIVVLSCLSLSQLVTADDRFDVLVQREKTADGLIIGTLSVNGENLGTCYEHAEKKIPAGTYPGYLRTTSSKNFAQRLGGKLGKIGDFLLEIGKVPKRTDILFHAGNKASHTTGCVLCGPAICDGDNSLIAPELLKKLRLRFYGTDTPNSTPNKTITITIRDR